MMVSPRTGVTALWWTVSLLADISSNFPAPSPHTTHSSLGAVKGPEFLLAGAVDDPQTSTHLARRTQSRTHVEPREHREQKESEKFPSPTSGLEVDGAPDILLTTLAAHLTHAPRGSEIVLLWNELFSDIATEAVAVVQQTAMVPVTLLKEERSCSLDSLENDFCAQPDPTLDGPQPPTLAIFLCPQPNITWVRETRREWRRRGSPAVRLLFPHRHGKNSTCWREERKGEEEGKGCCSESDNYLSEVSLNLHPLTPTHLKGRNFKVAAVENWPFFGLRKGSGGRVEADAGIDVSILNTLSQVLNFTYEVELEEGGQWGGPQPDGTVTGIIGMVARGEVHLAIDEITITSARKTVVDFTVPYFMESSACASRAPKEKSRAFAVLSPFTFQVWVSVVISVVVISFVLWLTNALISQYRKDEAGVETLLCAVTFNMFSSLVAQNNSLVTTKLWPLRPVLIGWYLYCLCLSALYSGTLTSVLVLPVYEKPIDSLEGLIEATKQGFYPVTTSEISIDFLFQTATSGIYQQIGRLMTSSKNYVDSASSGITRILQGPVVYIDGRLNMEMHIIKQGRDKFYLGRQSFFPQTYGIACTKEADYLEAFDLILARIVESGLVEKWKKDEFLKLDSGVTGAGGKRGGQTNALTISHLQGAFFLYVMGLTLALAALMLERTEFVRMCVKPPSSPCLD